MKLNKKYIKPSIWTAAVLLLMGFVFCLPQELFREPVSLVINSREGKLLGARIAKDGQWRFPQNEVVPEKFKTCIMAFEDKRFDSHIGIDFLALGRAIKLNFTKNDVVSGGSTLTMQTIRLSRKGQERSYFEKVIEMILALRLELKYTKAEILSYYTSYAPFGGNVVGLDAASWKYYARPSSQLTWSETATLAVLPNSPALIHPGRNRIILEKKRNFLLKKLQTQGTITQEEYQLALLEPLPDRPRALPNITPHLIDRYLMDTEYLNTKKQINTTIDFHLQEKVNREVLQYAMQLTRNGISNAGVMIMDVHTNEVLVYCGNTPKMEGSRDNSVDMITAKRSTGSIIKPFLYAFSLEEGKIMNESLLDDVPSNYAGFTPKNHDRSYEGVVKASDALSRSLNVPMVKLLHDYGQARFYKKIKTIGMNTLDKDAKHYGLSLILGGAETSIWDISAMYSGMVRSVEDYNAHGAYRTKCFDTPYLIQDTSRKVTFESQVNPISAASAFYTLEAMNEVKRPGIEAAWQNFASSRKIAWKTGTSFGNRDAWAVGCTSDYVVAVWVGNADGEGRPDMTGTFTASPLLFRVFNLLPTSKSWFQMPQTNMEKVDLCASSGYLAGKNCPKVVAKYCGKNARYGKVCNYCTTIHTDSEGKHQVHADCYSPHDMLSKNVFVLSPTEEYFYSKSHPDYQKLPEFLPSCETQVDSKAMDFLYPKLKSNIYIPITLDGNKGRTIFEVNHRNPETLIYWHLDEEFLGTTSNIHQMELNPSIGEHTIVLVDELGERMVRKFKIIGKL